MIYTDILSGSHCVSGWSWEVEPYAHKGFTLWYVRHGSGTLEYGDDEYRLSAGDAFLFDYSRHLAASQDESDPISIIFTDFCVDGDPRLHEMPCHCFSGEDSILPALLKRILGCFQDEDYSAFSVFLAAAIEEYGRLAAVGRITRTTRIVSEVCTQMHDNPAVQFNISDTAAKYGYTSDHFIRLFRKETGKTPYEYLMSVRMNTAKSLLLTSNMEIKEIALSCGFDDIYAFSHFFRKKAGISPKQYRLSRMDNTGDPGLPDSTR